MKDILAHFELTDIRLVGIMTKNASSNFSITRVLQSTLEASGTVWPALWNHIACIAHVMQLAIGASMSSLCVNGCTKSWEAHERAQHFGENESIDIGKSQILLKQGNATINMVLAMRPAFAKIIKKVHIVWYFESPETNLHIAENTCCIDYTDTWLSTWVHWLSNNQLPQCGTTCYACEDILELDTGDGWMSLLIMRSHPHVARKSQIQWFLVTHHNTEWIDHC